MPYSTTDMTQLLGIGSYVGEVVEGPDSQLYEWVEGVDGLGNPIGFWKKFKGIVKKALPIMKTLAPALQFIPGVGPAINTAVTAAGWAQKAGLLGLGEVIEGVDGQMYEVVEGIGNFGERKKMVQRVWLSVPATIRPRMMAPRPPMPPRVRRPQTVRRAPVSTRPPYQTDPYRRFR